MCSLGLTFPRWSGHSRLRSLHGCAASVLMLLLVFCIGSCTGRPEVGGNDLSKSPYFISPGQRNISTTMGQTAYLHCQVAQLGDKAQVSWIRKRDLHVLSSGVIVFASDARFQVIHPVKSENWTLQIKFAQLRDSGIYECQVNTNPKIYLSYYLTVVESRAVIQGPEYVKTGSTINLTCVVNQAYMQGLIYWYHNNEMIQYGKKSEVSISTQGDNQQVTSHLSIASASPRHSGNYTCWPTSAKPNWALINVVVEGEQPAAMQTGAACRHQSSMSISLAVISILQFCKLVSSLLYTEPFLLYWR